MSAEEMYRQSVGQEEMLRALDIREMQTKTTLKHCLTPVRMRQSSQNQGVGVEDVEKLEP